MDPKEGSRDQVAVAVGVHQEEDQFLTLSGTEGSGHPSTAEHFQHQVVVEQVQAADRGMGQQTKGRRQQRKGVVDRLEQEVQQNRDRQIDEECGQVGSETQAEERFGIGDVVGGGRGIAGYE